tara:strand:- start:630 stop:803 length:174 start_codon:yes stop_codon:yes gene_type:complete
MFEAEGQIGYTDFRLFLEETYHTSEFAGEIEVKLKSGSIVQSLGTTTLRNAWRCILE